MVARGGEVCDREAQLVVHEETCFAGIYSPAEQCSSSHFEHSHMRFYYRLLIDQYGFWNLFCL